MKDTRTSIEKFEEICEAANSGNWSAAANLCVKYSFFAGDLVTLQKTLTEEGINILQMEDMVFLAQHSTANRHKG